MRAHVRLEVGTLVIRLPARLVVADERLRSVVVVRGCHDGGQEAFAVITGAQARGREERNDGHSVALDQVGDEALVGVREHDDAAWGEVLPGDCQRSHSALSRAE